MARMRRPALLAMAVVLVASIVTGVRASAAPVPATTSATSSAFSQTETISRTNQIPGGNVTVDTRTVTLNVSQTANLQGRQEIKVSWTGAHPTGGIVADQNSIGAQLEEYPFVLLECRGVGSASAPASSQVGPQTCWTQTWSEHYQDSLGDPYPPYRIDQYASATPQPAIVGAPTPLPKSCLGYEDAPVQDWVPFVAADGQVYPAGNGGCAGEPAESDDVGGSALPSNETFGVTGLDETGTANFDIFTSAENASLGCSQTVACSLVAVPIMGISCLDAAAIPASDIADIAQCQQSGAFAPGFEPIGQQTPDLTVTGSLWWAPSNWRNRITVPLTFATPSDVCSVTGSTSNNVIDIYGSELMIQATSQWEPNFCLDPKLHFSFIHVQAGEPQSRNLVASGSAEAAFTSDAQPGGYGKPVVNAPVAVTGFAISYAIDGANGVPYTSLKLTPLLLAKLLTESYPGDLFLKNDDPAAFAHNPLNITMDPEFTALNPGVAPNPTADDDPAAELIALSSDSDVMEALTSYINADPTAKAWLNGTPDAASGGMIVNPAYKGIQLPVNQWPLLSTFIPKAQYATDLNDCLFNDPVPYQPLVAAPLANLSSISEAVQYALPNSTTTCSQPAAPSTLGEKLVTSGRQPAGHRFMIGITPLADTQRYLLQTAALQTTSGAFVAPTASSLQAVTNLLTPDTTTGTWPIPYTTFGKSAGASAYPGTMLVYAAIPTTGLPKVDAADYASLLRFAATSGQTAGSGVGQLPPGYLPLTAADGLGQEAQYTLAAASDVAAQNGQVPSMTGSTTTGGASSGSGANGSVGTGLFGDGSLGYSGSVASFADSGGASSSATGAAHHQLPVDRTAFRLVHPGAAVGVTLWTGSSIMVLVLALALLGVLGIPALFTRGRRRGRW
jgi:hypothetical protein